MRANFCARVQILVFGILVLGLYLLFNTPHPAVALRSEPREKLTIARLEKEIAEDSRSVDVEFKSPYNDEFFKDPGGDRSKEFTLDLKGGKARPDAENHELLAHKRVVKHNKLWIWADEMIGRDMMFPEQPEVDELLHLLATAKIVHVDKLENRGYEGGTSEKWIVTLEGGQKAMLKILWEEWGVMKRGALCNVGYEMPSSEIAAFHLHRILGFRNTPYVSGRKIDLVKEILPVATPEVRRQIIQNDDGACVVGKCFFCKTETHHCPSQGIIQASLAYWIHRPLKLYTYPPGYMPWSTPRMDEWGKVPFNNDTYCQQVQKDIVPYERSWFYYDLFDFAVLDTLMYHFDSKHYVIYDESPARGLTIRLDHGRAFCASDRDDIHIFLAPLTQCCTLRKSTYLKLLTVKNAENLSSRWNQSMALDPLSPVMDNVWFPAIERRLKIIMDAIDRCAKARGGLEHVLVPDH